MKVHREPYMWRKDNRTMGIMERCHFCGFPTVFWHENTNNPVCPTCSKKHKISELPDYGQAIRRAKRKKREAERKAEQTGKAGRNT